MKLSWLLPHQLWLYPILYILITVGFAFCYYLMPGQFYHTTIQHEPETDTIDDELRKLLSRELERNISPERPDSVLVGDWQVHAWVSSLKLSPPTPEGRQSLVARTMFQCMLRSKIGRFHIHYNIAISTGGSIGSPPFEPIRDSSGDVKIVEKTSYQVRTVEFEEVNRAADRIVYLQNMDTPEIAQFFECTSIPLPGEYCIELSEDVDDLLQDYISILLGRPRSPLKSFPRMLYLSAITVTTLGSGDILPLTGTARTLVTIESLLGPLLFGMFLAALTGRFKPKKKSPKNIQPDTIAESEFDESDDSKDENNVDSKLESLKESNAEPVSTAEQSDKSDSCEDQTVDSKISEQQSDSGEDESPALPSDVVELIVERFVKQRKVQVPGCARLKFIEESDCHITVASKKGKKVKIQFSQIEVAVEAVREDPKIYSDGPSGLRKLGLTYNSTQIWALLHLCNLEELRV